MPWFRSKSNAIDETVDDETWLLNGHRRFDEGKGRHFGSPETMRDGGLAASQRGDVAAAVFYFGKAIDIAQTWTFSKPGERPLHLDEKLFGLYADTIDTIRSTRPRADIVTDWNNENAKYVIPMMISVVRSWGDNDTGRLDFYISRVVAAASTTPLPNGEGTQQAYISSLVEGMGYSAS